MYQSRHQGDLAAVLYVLMSYDCLRNALCLLARRAYILASCDGRILQEVQSMKLTPELKAQHRARYELRARPYVVQHRREEPGLLQTRAGGKFEFWEALLRNRATIAVYSEAV